MKKLITKVIVEYSNGADVVYQGKHNERIEVDCGMSFYRITIKKDSYSYLINLRDPGLRKIIIKYENTNG